MSDTHLRKLWIARAEQRLRCIMLDPIGQDLGKRQPRVALR
jgi:hypothetical protein